MKLIARILLAIITFGLLSLLFTSCLYRKEVAIRKFCQQDSSTFKGTIQAQVAIQAPPDTAKFLIEIATLKKTITKLEDHFAQQSDSIITIYSDSLHEVTISIDTSNPIPTTKWQVRDKAPRIIHDTVPVPIEIKVPCKCPEPDKWFNWQYYLYGALIGIAAILLFTNIRRV